jgi:hypothetical protein
MGDAMQPVADLGPGEDGSGAADEDQEGGLEGVLGVGLVAQDAAADTQDHGAVTAQQGLKSGPVVARDKALQEVAVSSLGGRGPEGGPAQILEQAGQSSARHHLHPFPPGVLLPIPLSGAVLSIKILRAAKRILGVCFNDERRPTG